MGRRVACLMLLAALVAAVAAVASKESSSIAQYLKPRNQDAWREALSGRRPVRGPPSTSIEDNKTGKATTMGAVSQFARLIHPITEILLLLVDSWLRNTRQRALPCKVSSFVPLKGVCTPIQ